MKNYKKQILFYAIAAIITVQAAALPGEGVLYHSAAPYIQSQHTESVSPYAEETVWVHRIYNGKEQKRLWSYTEGRWLTGWIDC